MDNESNTNRDPAYEKAKSEAKAAVASAFWLLVVAAYLLVSFLTRRWDLTWLIFVAAAAVQAVFKAGFALRDLRRFEGKK